MSGDVCGVRSEVGGAEGGIGVFHERSRGTWREERDLGPVPVRPKSKW